MKSLSKPFNNISFIVVKSLRCKNTRFQSCFWGLIKLKASDCQQAWLMFASYCLNKTCYLPCISNYYSLNIKRIGCEIHIVNAILVFYLIRFRKWSLKSMYYLPQKAFQNLSTFFYKTSMVVKSSRFQDFSVDWSNWKQHGTHLSQWLTADFIDVCIQLLN